jgi:hypothetical protein
MPAHCLANLSRMLSIRSCFVSLFDADEVGPSLRHATAMVVKMGRDGAAGFTGGCGGRTASLILDPPVDLG